MTGPRRKSLRLPGFDYSDPGAYFVTVCTADRRCLFGDVVNDEMRLNRPGRILDGCWRATPRHFSGTVLDASAVMPNHLQAILWFERAGHGPPLHTIIGLFKGAVTRRAGRPVWQRSFHDRLIRNDRELDAYREYIEANPVNWALDRESPDSTPTRGEGPRG